MWEIFYKDNPEEYKEHLRKEKEKEICFQNELLEKRQKLARVLLKPYTEEINHFIQSLSFEELTFYYEQAKGFTQIFEKRYLHTFQKEVQEPSKTRFVDAIHQLSWEEVEVALQKVVEKPETVYLYKSVWEELIRLTPTIDDDPLIIAVQPKREKNEDGKEEIYYNVCGLNSKNGTPYGIEYTLWDKWLGWFCHQGQLDKLGAPLFIAHCMWEMTFLGMNQAAVQQKIDELEEVENMYKRE